MAELVLAGLLLSFLAFCFSPSKMCNIETGTTCTDCTSTPARMKVEVTGTLAQDNCDACESFPATYYVAQDGTFPCEWLLETCHCTNTVADKGFVKVLILTSGPNYILRVELSVENTSIGDVAIYDLDLGTSKPNCLAFNQETLTFDSMNPDNSRCGDWSSLGVKVSATNVVADEELQCGYLQWNTGPNQFTATANSSPSNNGCTDCSELTTAVTLTRGATVGTCCQYNGSYAGSNCTYQYRLTISNSTYQLLISTDNHVTNATFQLTGLTDPHDGQVTRTLSLVGDAAGDCIFTGVTFDIAAV